MWSIANCIVHAGCSVDQLSSRSRTAHSRPARSTCRSSCCSNAGGSNDASSSEAERTDRIDAACSKDRSKDRSSSARSKRHKDRSTRARSTRARSRRVRSRRAHSKPARSRTAHNSHGGTGRHRHYWRSTAPTSSPQPASTKQNVSWGGLLQRRDTTGNVMVVTSGSCHRLPVFVYLTHPSQFRS